MSGTLVYKNIATSTYRTESIPIVVGEGPINSYLAPNSGLVYSSLTIPTGATYNVFINATCAPIASFTIKRAINVVMAATCTTLATFQKQVSIVKALTQAPVNTVILKFTINGAIAPLTQSPIAKFSKSVLKSIAAACSPLASIATQKTGGSSFTTYPVFITAVQQPIASFSKVVLLTRVSQMQSIASLTKIVKKPFALAQSPIASIDARKLLKFTLTFAAQAITAAVFNARKLLFTPSNPLAQTGIHPMPAQYSSSRAVTLSDTVQQHYYGFIVTNGGFLTIRGQNDTVDSTIPVLASIIYPIEVSYLKVAGSTATGIFGLS
jgi:hypothetical protein